MKGNISHKRLDSRQTSAPRHTRSNTGIPTSLSFTAHKSKGSESFNILPKEPKGLLSTIRTRKKNLEVPVSPEIASAVIKTYLIPMFEAETHTKKAQVRKSIFKTQPSEGGKADNSTVYSELKLSDKLNEKLRQAEAVIENLRKQLKEAHQLNYETQKELDHDRMDVVKIRTSGQIWMLQCEEMKKARQTVELTITLLRSQTRELRDMCISLEEQLKHTKETMHAERSQAEKWRNRVIELEHNSQIMQMTNDVMTEHLKGLYEAIVKSLNVNTVQQKFSSELDVIFKSSKSLAQLDSYLSEQNSLTLFVLDSFKHEFEAAMKLQSETKQEKDKLSSLFKDYSVHMEQRITHLTEELEGLKEEHEHLSKVHKSLGEEYEKNRQRVKQFRSKRKTFGQAEEKVCKRCQKVYAENENFNWSCKTHSSDFGGEVYWCCGKPSKDAPGCRLAKHESKEDDEETSDVEGRTIKTTSRLCISCKQYGHTAQDCPLDPNIRTNADYLEEMSRIQNVKTKKNTVMQIESNEFQAALEGRLSPKGPFINQQVTSPNYSDDSEASLREELGADATTFVDIANLKKSTAKIKKANRFFMEPIITKEQELNRRKKTLSPNRSLSMLKASLVGSLTMQLNPSTTQALLSSIEKVKLNPGNKEETSSLLKKPLA